MATKEREQIERIMKGLKCSEQEAIDVYNYDKLIDKEEKERHQYDLTAEQQKASRQYTRADRKPTTYKFAKKERKPNATKGAIISALAEWLKNEMEWIENDQNFVAEEIEITNKERQIIFKLCGETFELTLVQKRKK